jgi:hypothetical protein
MASAPTKRISLCGLFNPEVVNTLHLVKPLSECSYCENLNESENNETASETANVCTCEWRNLCDEYDQKSPCKCMEAITHMHGKPTCDAFAFLRPFGKQVQNVIFRDKLSAFDFVKPLAELERSEDSDEKKAKQLDVCKRIIADSHSYFKKFGFTINPPTEEDIAAVFGLFHW